MGGRRPGLRAASLLCALLFAGTGCTAASAAADAARPVMVGAARAVDPPEESAAVVGDDWRRGSGIAGLAVPADGQPDWSALAREGRHFVYLKVSDGSGHVNAAMAEQREAARAAGLLVGGYHLARPAQSSGTLQGRVFAASGGSWAPDGRTLPGMLVLRGAEGEDACSGLAPGDLRGWVHDFATEYRRLTGRQPVLSTTAQWWATCVGPAGDLGGLDLALRDPADLPGDLPEGWERPVLWLTGEPGGPGDTTYFGTLHELRQWAVSALR